MMDNKVVISKVLEKEKAMNKYTDSISSGNFAFDLFRKYS
jgi:hypothetical protein